LRSGRAAKWRFTPAPFSAAEQNTKLRRHNFPLTSFNKDRKRLMSEKRLSHVVFFTLKDSSDAAIQTLLDACHKYLKDHPGVVYFGAGTLAKEYARPVNDHAFHVCLNVVFDSRASHDIYQTAPDHLKFIADHKESWEKVRVFDADVT
jgi:hypothetical protein